MGWKRESSRHSMASRGISTKQMYTRGMYVTQEETDDFMHASNSMRMAYADANNFGFYV